MSEINTLLAQDCSAVVQRVQRSLVVVKDWRGGAGAGIVWRRGGWIVTNYHVVARGRAVRVVMPDGRVLPARIAARDKEVDLALLQVDDKQIAPLMAADSRGLRVGQYVMAIGHPWGERGLVTGGLISGLGKLQTRNGRGEVEVIRSDVRLAPGNSGGPLVNAAGAVIGVNTMIVGGDLGVAVPSHVVNSFIEQAVAKDGGKTAHPQDKEERTPAECFV